MTAATCRLIQQPRRNARQRDESRRTTIIELETHFGVCVYVWLRCMHSAHAFESLNLNRILFGSLCVFHSILWSRLNDFMVWCTSSFNGIYFACEELAAKHMRIWIWWNTRYPNTCSTQWPYIFIAWHAMLPRASCTACVQNQLSWWNDGHVLFNAF